MLDVTFDNWPEKIRHTKHIRHSDNAGKKFQQINSAKKSRRVHRNLIFSFFWPRAPLKLALNFQSDKRIAALKLECPFSMSIGRKHYKLLERDWVGTIRIVLISWSLLRLRHRQISCMATPKRRARESRTVRMEKSLASAMQAIKITFYDDFGRKLKWLLPFSTFAYKLHLYTGSKLLRMIWVSSIIIRMLFWNISAHPMDTIPGLHWIDNDGEEASDRMRGEALHEQQEPLIKAIKHSSLLDLKDCAIIWHFFLYRLHLEISNGSRGNSWTWSVDTFTIV